MKRNRATPERQQVTTLASTQAEFLQNWRLDQERQITQGRDALALAMLHFDAVEKALKELV